MELISHVGNEVASTCIESGQLIGYEQIYLNFGTEFSNPRNTITIE